LSDLDAVVGGNANCDVQRVVGIIPFRRWTVVVPRIPGYVHVAALQELVDAVFYGLRQLEQNVSLGDPDDAVPGNAILIRQCHCVQQRARQFGLDEFALQGAARACRCLGL
jgi:hypothetical protein